MKKLIAALLFLIFACASHQIRFQPDGVIYISEIVTLKNTGENKTLLSAFHPDGTQVKKLEIDGLMARMSPDQDRLVYINVNRDPGQSPWDLVIADSNGQQVKTLPFLTKAAKQDKFVQDIAWSPDGDKLSILLISNEFVRGRIKGYQIFAVAFDLKTERILQIYKEFCPSLEDPCYYGLGWFKDSRRLLLSGSSGIQIIDLTTHQTRSITDSPARAQLLSGDQKLIAITALPQDETFSQIRTYDLKTGLIGTEIPVGFYPKRFVASRDGRSILLQGKPPRTNDIFTVALADRLVNQLEIPDMILLPMTFSPGNSQLVACIGGKEVAGYGIYDLINGTFFELKQFDENAPRGEKVVLSVLLNRIDWFASVPPLTH